MPEVKRCNTISEKQRDYWIYESVKDKKFEDCYDIEKELATGPFGTLQKCKPRGQKIFCCVKIIPKQKGRHVAYKEVSFLLKLNHPNVGRLREIFETADSVYFVSDLLTGNEVLDRTSRRKTFTERDAAKILTQILEGLKYIHEEDLIHCNLKPENFIYENENEDSNIKIADIAVYTLLDKQLLMHAITATPQYCAPEVLRNEMGNPASDMWSFGVFAYLLLCGEEPFQADSEEELYKKIFKASYERGTENYQKLSTNAKDFLMNILTVDPKNRLTAFQALGNKWLRGKATKFDNLSLTIDTMRENIIRKKTQAFLINQSKQWRNKKPSLCQKYLPKDVYMWLQKTTKYGTSLVDCVKSGVENPDSIIGLYAPDSDCYDVFPEIFWPVISDYHKIDVFSLKAHHEYGAPNDLPDFEPPYADDIFSVRIKVGRTLKNYPMGPKLSRETRQLIKNEMIQSFADLNGEQYGDFFELTDLSYEERDSLIQSHYLFNNADDKYLRSAGGYADWPLNRGIFMNRAKTFVVWLNEEDHVRVISLERGSNVRKAYSRFIKGIETIEKNVEFAFHEKFGYLTFCPTNIGTGLGISMHVRLPKLAASGVLKELCSHLDLKARDINDKYVDVARGVYDISNKVKIGQTEFEIVNSVCVGVKRLLDEEYKTE